MTREQYLTYRNSNVPSYLYEYYKEKFNSSKHSPFLEERQFYQSFIAWPMRYDVKEKVEKYYDNLFSVMKIPNKEGIYYKFL